MLKRSFPFLHQTVYFKDLNFFHSSSSCLSAKSQLGNYFIKLGHKFGDTQKKKKQYFKPNVVEPDKVMQSIMVDRKKKFIRRENVLNKLFMTHITDFMANSDAAPEFLARGIEISKVQVSSDFKFLNVLWIAKNFENDVETQELLNKYAFVIRDLLSQLRVVGNVPLIKFVKDSRKAQISIINNILSKADYGEDFTPVYPSLLKSDSVEPIDLEKLNEAVLDDTNTMPPMRQDVFGVNHAEIMKEIEAVVKKSKADHRQPGFKTLPSDIQHKETSKAEPLRTSETMSYSQFIKQQKILKSKMKQQTMDLLNGEIETSESEKEFWFNRDSPDEEDESDLDQYSDEDDQIEVDENQSR